MSPCKGRTLRTCGRGPTTTTTTTSTKKRGGIRGCTAPTGTQTTLPSRERGRNRIGVSFNLNFCNKRGEKINLCCVSLFYIEEEEDRERDGFVVVFSLSGLDCCFQGGNSVFGGSCVCVWTFDSFFLSSLCIFTLFILRMRVCVCMV